MKPVMVAQPDESRAASIQITRPRGLTSRPPLCLPLRPERERLGRRQRHVLQVGLARPTDVGQRADVGMIEPRSGAGLALEAGAHLGRRGQVRGLDLDGDITAEAGVAGSIHPAHRPALSGATALYGPRVLPAASMVSLPTSGG